MRTSCCFLLPLISFVINLHGQSAFPIAISASGGSFKSPAYENAIGGGFVKGSVEVSVYKNHFLQLLFQKGDQVYLERARLNYPLSPLYEKSVNASNYCWLIAAGYKYNLKLSDRICIMPGIGVGMIRESFHFDYYIGPYYSMKKEVTHNLVLPVSLDAMYLLFKHWQIGMTGGFYSGPDKPFLKSGLHAGPQIKFTI